MVRDCWIIGLVMVTAGLSGCGKTPDAQVATGPEPGAPATHCMDAIAVIDLNVVAEEIGARRKITESLKQREAELVHQLNGFRDELGRRVTEIKTQSDSDLNDQNQSDLDKTLAENEAKISLQAQAAQTQLAAHHARLKLQLLNQVRPVAFQVAQSRGLSIVMTTSQVYAVAPERDITQEVIQAIQQLNDSNLSQAPPPRDPGIRLAEMPGGGEFMPR